MLRMKPRTRFPKAIDTEIQKTCFNENMLAETTQKNIKDKLMQHVLETLPYMVDTTSFDWMDTTYTHPLDRGATEIATKDVQRFNNVISLKTFLGFLRNQEVFDALKDSFPYSITENHALQNNTMINKPINPLRYHIPDIGTFGPETLQLLQFRLRYPEAIARIAGGYRSNTYTDSIAQMADIKYPAPVSVNGYGDALPIGSYSTDISESLGHYRHLISSKTSIPAISQKFVVPDNIAEFYKEDEIVQNDPILGILNSASKVLPKTAFDYILNAYGMVDVWGRYNAMVNANRAYTNLATSITAQIPGNQHVSWKNRSYDSAGAGPPANPIQVIYDGAQINTVPSHEDVRYSEDRTSYNTISFDIEGLFPHAAPALDPIYTQRILDHITTLHYFGEFVCAPSPDISSLAAKKRLDQIGYYVHGHAQANVAPPADSIIILPPESAEYLLKLKYLLSLGSDVYRSIYLTMGFDNTNQSQTNRLTRNSPAYITTCAIGIANPQTAPVTATTFMDRIPMFAPIVTSAFDATQNAVGQTEIPMPYQRLLKYTPENIKFIGTYALHAYPAYHTGTYQNYGQAQVIENDLASDDIGKQYRMFWTGMSMDEWTVTCAFNKSLLNKLCLVMGLYDEDVIIGGVATPITYCGILDQIPDSKEVSRVCFLPYTYGDRTLFSSLKTVSKYILNDVAAVNAMDRLNYRKAVMIDPQAKLFLTKKQFDTFMAMVKEADTPIKALAAFCIVTSTQAPQGGVPVIPQAPESVNFSDLNHYIQTLWMILTRLGYRVMFNDVSQDTTGRMYVYPQFTIATLEAKLNRENKNNAYKNAIKAILVRCKPLLDFLAYPITFGKKKSLGTTKDEAAAGKSEVVFGHNFPRMGNVDVVEAASLSSEEAVKNARLMTPEYENFYNNASNIYMNTMSMDEGLKAIAEQVPISIRAHTKMMQNIDPQGASTTEGLKMIAEQLDVAGGFFIDEILAGYDNTLDTEQRLEGDMKKIMQSIEASLGVRRSGYSGAAQMPLLNPFDTAKTKFLNSGLHSSQYVSQLMTRIRTLETAAGAEVADEVKDGIMVAFKNIANSNRELYKFALQVDFLQKIIDFLRASRHNIEDAELPQAIFDTAYTRLKPLASSILKDFDGKIIKNLVQLQPTVVPDYPTVD